MVLDFDPGHIPLDPRNHRIRTCGHRTGHKTLCHDSDRHRMVDHPNLLLHRHSHNYIKVPWENGDKDRGRLLHHSSEAEENPQSIDLVLATMRPYCYDRNHADLW